MKLAVFFIVGQGLIEEILASLEIDLNYDEASSKSREFQALQIYCNFFRLFKLNFSLFIFTLCFYSFIIIIITIIIHIIIIIIIVIIFLKYKKIGFIVLIEFTILSFFVYYSFAAKIDPFSYNNNNNNNNDDKNKNSNEYSIKNGNSDSTAAAATSYSSNDESNTNKKASLLDFHLSILTLTDVFGVIDNFDDLKTPIIDNDNNIL
jgi:hypothetical protein